MSATTQSSSAVPKKSIKEKETKPKPTHPPTSEMVNNALKNLNERGGSSILAIKKYIATTYKVDTDKLSTFIKKYVKAAVISGTLVQTKGTGATGSFKLPSKNKVKKDVQKAEKPKKTTAAKPKSPVAKPKAKSVKKPKDEVKMPKKTASASPKKSSLKKTTKSPVKPKAPKPKKASPKKK